MAASIEIWNRRWPPRSIPTPTRNTLPCKRHHRPKYPGYPGIPCALDGALNEPMAYTSSAHPPGLRWTLDHQPMPMDQEDEARSGPSPGSMRSPRSMSDVNEWSQRLGPSAASLAPCSIPRQYRRHDRTACAMLAPALVGIEQGHRARAGDSDI